jgi:hypothetical protein
MKADVGEGKEGKVDRQAKEKEAPDNQEKNIAAVALQATIYTALKEQLEALQKVFTIYTYFHFIILP